MRFDVTMFFEPFAPLFELSRRMDPARGATWRTARSFVPGADIVVTDDDITVMLDVPGVSMDDLEIELRDDVLTVRGERRMPYESETGERVWYRLERGFGSFERALRVPAGLDAGGIEASLVDGVLSVRIPMPASRKPRRIPIGERRQGVIEEGAVTNGSREPAGAPA